MLLRIGLGWQSNNCLFQDSDRVTGQRKFTNFAKNNYLKVIKIFIIFIGDNIIYLKIVFIRLVIIYSQTIKVYIL